MKKAPLLQFLSLAVFTALLSQIYLPLQNNFAPADGVDLKFAEGA